jgi:hypothetical protein
MIFGWWKKPGINTTPESDDFVVVNEKDDPQKEVKPVIEEIILTESKPDTSPVKISESIPPAKLESDVQLEYKAPDTKHVQSRSLLKYFICGSCIVYLCKKWKSIKN